MPLRDHFHPPFSTRYSWDVVHGGLPMTIATHLNTLLPDGYMAGPNIHIGSFGEVDIGAMQEPPSEWEPGGAGTGGAGGTAVAEAVWAPAVATLEANADWAGVDDYEVQVYDVTRSRELVASIEIVSPSNKDRPAHRATFATKCAALLANDVSVVVVDFVTERESNLYAEMLGVLSVTDPAVSDPPPGIYAVACRRHRVKRKRKLQSWYHPLVIGQPLPTLPVWITEQLVFPLELEMLYEQTLRALKIK